MDEELKINKKIFDYAIRLLSMRDYSTHKLTGKLKSRDFTEEEIQPVIDKLIHYNYLREEAYTKARIKQFLQKGFSNHLILIKLTNEKLTSTNETIDQVREEQDLSEENQIQKIILKKLRSKEIPENFEDKTKLKNKIISFLCSKGHCPEKATLMLLDHKL